MSLYHPEYHPLRNAYATALVTPTKLVPIADDEWGCGMCRNQRTIVIFDPAARIDPFHITAVAGTRRLEVPCPHCYTHRWDEVDGIPIVAEHSPITQTDTGPMVLIAHLPIRPHWMRITSLAECVACRGFDVVPVFNPSCHDERAYEQCPPDQRVLYPPCPLCRPGEHDDWEGWLA